MQPTCSRRVLMKWWIRSSQKNSEKRWVYSTTQHKLCDSYIGLSGQGNIISGLLLGRSEVLRSLRHYLRAQSQGHHTIDRLRERVVERGSARWSSLKGRERAIVNQTNIGTVSKATLGNLWETHRYHLQLNWTEPRSSFVILTSVYLCDSCICLVLWFLHRSDFVILTSV